VSWAQKLPRLRDFNQSITKAYLDLDHETKKTKKKTQHVRTKIQQAFIANKKQNKVVTRKCTQN
jgi:hypothetical protein